MSCAETAHGVDHTIRLLQSAYERSVESEGMPADVTRSPVSRICRAWGELVGPEGRCRLANLPTRIHLRDCKIVLKGEKKKKERKHSRWSNIARRQVIARSRVYMYIYV